MRDRERHRRQHVRGVVFLVDGLVADHRPAGGLDHFDVEAVLGIEAHRRRHDDRRGAGDRDEADLEVLLLERPALREHFGRGLEREELRQRGQRGRGADRLQECAPRGVLRKHRAHHRGGDHALVALLLARDGSTAQRGGAAHARLRGLMPATSSSRHRRTAVGIERIVEGGHRTSCASFATELSKEHASHLQAGSALMSQHFRSHLAITKIRDTRKS